MSEKLNTSTVALSSLLGLSLLFGAGVAGAKGPPPGKGGPQNVPACDHVFPLPVPVPPYYTCEEDLGTLCYAIEAAGSLKTKDADGMKNKDYDAVDKINEDKYEDAYQKLGDIQFKLDKLLAGNKVSGSDYTAIDDALDDAKDCVFDLMP